MKRRLLFVLAMALLPGAARASGAADLAEARLAAAAAEPARRSEHLAAAIAALERALGVREDERDLVVLARARLLVGRRQAARDAAVRAAALAPEDPLALAAVADAALADGDPRAAAEAAERALVRAGDPALRACLFRQLARARLRLDDPAAARTAVRDAREIELASADGASLAAWCEQRAALRFGRRDEAAVPGFRVVSTIGPDAAARAARRIAAVAPEFERLFPAGPPPARPVPVYILSEADLRRIAPPGPPARAFYQRDEAAVFAIGEKPRELERLLAHECFHAHLHRVLPDAPAWLDEGYADWFGGSVTGRDGALFAAPEPVRLRDLQVAIAAGREVRLRDLAERGREAFYDGADVYLRFATAWGFVHYFRAKEGGRLDRYAARLLAGGSPEEAFSDALGGADVVAIEAAMRAHVLGLSAE
jgi:hypothetical protein